VAAAWGNGERNDWALAAERAGNLILGIVDFKPPFLLLRNMFSIS
jgi:hypothetical protein